MPRALREAPPRARRSDHHRTRRRILDAARRLLGEQGPESLTISGVARAAQINRTTAYQHFRTRDELVRAVWAELITEVGERIGAPRPLNERIDDAVLYFVEHPEIARLSLHHLLGESPFPREYWRPYFDELSKIGAGGGTQSGVDAEMLAHVLMAVALLWPLSARADHENPAALRAATARFARELKRLLLYGVLRPDRCPELVASLSPPAGRRKP
jgi:AcrR family transcriptional regulator